MPEPQIITIVVPPVIFSEVRAAIEHAFPALTLFPMPAEANEEGEQSWGIAPKELY
jgi:hypothetical protein